MAAEYADSLHESIWLDSDSGYAFGYDPDREVYGEPAEISAYDFLEDALDIEFRVSSDGSFRSAEILIAYGGPNAMIDTRRSTLTVSWDTFETRSLPLSFIEALNEALAELWECSNLR